MQPLTEKDNIKDRVVIIEWLDARVSVDGEIPNCPIMQSIGVVIQEDKGKICIASLFAPRNEPRIITAIPRNLVKKIFRLRR